MSGMTTTGVSGLSDYDGRTVEIEVTGLCRQDVSRTSNYKVKVPHSSMVKTIQTINRMGGKISNINVVHLFSTPSEAESSGEEE